MVGVRAERRSADASGHDGADPPSPRGRPRRIPGIFLVGSMASSTVVVSRFLTGFAARWTNEDQTMLWYAGRDLGRGHLYQPTLYGRAYGSSLEAIPGELLRWIGVTPHIAYPLGSTLLFVVPWFVTAAMTWRRGHPVVAILAAGSPALLVLDALAVSATPLGWGASLFLAGMVMPIVVGWRHELWAGPAATFLGALAVAFNPGAALLVVPALLVVGIEHLRRWQLWVGSTIAALPAAIYFLLLRRFLDANPDYDMHKGAPLTPSWTVFRAMRSALPQHFDAFRLQLLPWWWVTAAVLFGSATVVAVVVRRRGLGLLVSLSGLAIIALALSAPKSLDFKDSVYLSPSRFILFLPHFVWLTWWLLADEPSRPRPWGGRGWGSGAGRGAWLATVAVVASAALFLVTFSSRAAEIHSKAVAAGFVVPVPTAALDQRCQVILEAAEREQTNLVVFRTDRPAAYGCGNELYGKITTIYPEYEARTWLIHFADSEPISRFLVGDAPPGWCERAAAMPNSPQCTEHPDGTATVELAAPSDLVDTWSQFGQIVRPLEGS